MNYGSRLKINLELDLRIMNETRSCPLKNTFGMLHRIPDRIKQKLRILLHLMTSKGVYYKWCFASWLIIQTFTPIDMLSIDLSSSDLIFIYIFLLNKLLHKFQFQSGIEMLILDSSV